MKKWIPCSVLLVCAIVFGSWLHSFFPPDIGVVILENDSGQDIVEATIRIREIELVFPKIPDGDFCAARYEIPGDSHYEVLVTLESGKTMSLESGYMTNGADTFDVMTVRKNQVVHRLSQPSGLFVPKETP
ncbi:MAG: hypothetical protein H0S80_14550 [Desulfovibrionaceae bacterium]|nr:hypothetical protein [Desulfovibrionaceae bacterium]